MFILHLVLYPKHAYWDTLVFQMNMSKFCPFVVTKNPLETPNLSQIENNSMYHIDNVPVTYNHMYFDTQVK